MPSSLLPSFSLFCFLLSFVFIFLFTISLFSFLFSHLSFSIVAPQLPIFPDSPLFHWFPSKYLHFPLLHGKESISDRIEGTLSGKYCRKTQQHGSSRAWEVVWRAQAPGDQPPQEGTEKGTKNIIIRKRRKCHGSPTPPRWSPKGPKGAHGTQKEPQMHAGEVLGTRRMSSEAPQHAGLRRKILKIVFHKSTK